MEDIEDQYHDVEAQYREVEDDSSSRSDYLSLLFSMLFIQVIYEYYLSFNFFILIIRTTHVLAGMRYKEARNAQDLAKAKTLVTLNLMTNMPILLLQFFYGPFKPLMIIFIGSAQPGTWLGVLAVDIVIAILYYLIFLEFKD